MSNPPDRLAKALEDRYTLRRELGHGGMATVYLAEDLKHHRPVALKVLKPELADALGPDRFLREIEVSARLTHPHILPLHDSGNADGLLFYVMPYVDGESLRDRLAREKQLPVDDALQISREVADALSYAHSHGVIHRDIKPENILLQAGHAVVADFGIARAIDQAGGDRLTSTGLTLGTPAYMSPEQAAGSGELDGRSDLYALGCVLYEMLAGQPPFVGGSVESVIRQHLAAEPPSITTIRPAVPAHVAATLDRALAKIPADRFNPVAQFAEALGARPAAVTTPGAPPSAAPQPGFRLPWRRIAVLATAVVVAVGGILTIGRWLRPDTPASGRARTGIAVLPLQNLSAEGPHAYFAGGLHDELLTQLAKVAALKVISRTSVMEYAAGGKPLRQIGEELDVGSIVEGSVQVVGDRLRVNVQLIDAATDEHLWAERYDRTLDDAFAVQSEIAQRIVRAVGATITGSEAGAIAAAPTADPEAYRLYLQGLEYWRRPGNQRQDWETAQVLYERAVALDSSFALARAGLSVVHGFMSWLRFDPSPERLVRQRAEAELALRLAPQLPQAHVAMGVVHSVHGDLAAALTEYETALRGLPNDAEIWARIGYTHRRLGNWEATFAAFEKAVQLDPRASQTFSDLGGGTLRALRRYPEAIEAFKRALALAPDRDELNVAIGWIYADWQGTLDTLRTALETQSPDSRVRGRAGLLLWERKPDSLLALIASSRQAVFETQGSLLPAQLYAAWGHEMRADERAALTAFDSARVVLDSVARRIGEDDWRIHAARGLVFAGLGRREHALAEARRLDQSARYQDAYFGAALRRHRALILARSGATDTAVAALEQLLSGPFGLTAHELRLDPRWDPIRTDPRFQALLVKYADPQPVR